MHRCTYFKCTDVQSVITLPAPVIVRLIQSLIDGIDNVNEHFLNRGVTTPKSM